MVLVKSSPTRHWQGVSQHALFHTHTVPYNSCSWLRSTWLFHWGKESCTTPATHAALLHSSHGKVAGFAQRENCQIRGVMTQPPPSSCAKAAITEWRVLLPYDAHWYIVHNNNRFENVSIFYTQTHTPHTQSLYRIHILSYPANF